ncbi:unnamed protein product [Caenorhabditis brenneri]
MIAISLRILTVTEWNEMFQSCEEAHYNEHFMGHSSITSKRFSRHAPKPFAPRRVYGPGPEYEAQWRARRRERERLDRLYRNYIKRTIENYKRVTSTIVAHHSHRFSMRPNGRQLKRRERYGLRNTIFFLNWLRALLWLGDSSSRGKFVRQWKRLTKTKFQKLRDFLQKQKTSRKNRGINA